MRISSTFLSGIHIELQVELVFSLIIITALCLFFIYAGKKVMAADPLEKPKGIVLVLSLIHI